MSNHVINRQIIELKLNSEKNAFRIQQRVRELYQTEVLPMLDKMMSTLTSENEVLQIDRLELDLGVLDFEKLDQEIMNTLRAHVEEQLKKEIGKAEENRADKIEIRAKKNLIQAGSGKQFLELGITGMEITDGNEFSGAILKSKDQSRLELLRLFFTDGLLPWWTADEFDAPDIDELVKEMLQKKPASLLQIFTEAVRNRTTASRIIQQLEKETLKSLFVLLPASSVAEIKKVWTELSKLITTSELAQLNKADTNVIFLAALMISNEYGNLNVAEEVIVKNLIKAGSVVIDKEVLKIEKIIYNEILIRLLSDDKKINQDNSLISYFSNWEKEKSETAVMVSGSKFLHVAALLNPIESRNIKQYQLLEKRIKEFLRKNDKKNNRKFQNPFSQEENKTDLEKIISSETELTEKNASDEFEEDSALKKTPAAGMTRYGGLALLSPFLPAFFKEMKLLVDDKFPSDAERYKAIHLLNFIATGKTKAAEYELMLHKLLCGLELRAPVPKTMKLSAAEKKEAMLFLDDIAEQWSALRTNSGEVLRNTFMRRNGIIEKKEDVWLLRVERTAVDIMLDTLPWTISIVKAPWMQQLLHIEW